SANGIVEHDQRQTDRPLFFSSRGRHTRLQGDWSSDVCSSDLLAQAASSYLTAIPQYAVAVRQAEALRREAETVIVRTRPVVLALGTGPGVARAATSLARAESLFSTMDYPLAKLAALDAEQAGLVAGVAPPSP